MIFHSYVSLPEGRSTALVPHSSHLLRHPGPPGRTAPTCQGKRATCRGSSRSQTTPARSEQRGSDEITQLGIAVVTGITGQIRYIYIYTYVIICIYTYLFNTMYIHNKELYVPLKWLRTPKCYSAIPSPTRAAVTAVFPVFFLDLDRWACPSGPHNLSHGCETNKCDQVSAAASSSGASAAWATHRKRWC